MPDLNKMLDDVQNQSKDITKFLERLLGTYENLYREGHNLYLRERVSSNDGMDEFHRLVQIIRRNRDVVGSLLRGLRNIRPISDFRFVEEDVPEVQKDPEIDPGRLAAVRVPEPAGVKQPEYSQERTPEKRTSKPEATEEDIDG